LEQNQKKSGPFDWPVAFTVDDINLVPQIGKLKSRQQAKLHPFLYSAPMDMVTGYDLTEALIDAGHNAVVSRRLPVEEWNACVRDFAVAENCERVFFAVGIQDDYTEFFANLETQLKDYDGWMINLALDVAHGDSGAAYKALSTLRELPQVNYLMSGSVCTPEAAYRQTTWATHIRIGVGPGAACSTRLMTGFGVPQAYAVASIHKRLCTSGLRKKITIIADGGIKNPGDCVKYLALGADACMLGSVFSKAREAPGWQLRTDGKLVKHYRGQASAEFQKDILGYESACPEGVQLPLMTWHGDTVESIVKYFEGGMRSGVSYAGLTSSSQLPTSDLSFVFTTSAGQREAYPHGLLGAMK